MLYFKFPSPSEKSEQANSKNKPDGISE